MPADYEGLDFQTKALQQSRVQLSWDEDEPDRVKTLKRKFNADQVGVLDLNLKHSTLCLFIYILKFLKNLIHIKFLLLQSSYL